MLMDVYKNCPTYESECYMLRMISKNYEMEKFNDANHNMNKFYFALEIAKRI